MHVEHIPPTVATPRWPAVLLPAVALAALAVWVRRAGVAGWEVSATGEVAAWPDAAGIVLRPAVELGNRVVAVVLALALGARRGWRAGVVAAAGVVVASLAASALKAVVARPRITAGELGAHPRHVVEGFSFPSSHVAVAAALAVGVVVATRPPRAVAVAVLVAPVLTGLGRMWLGAHLPLDVVGGALAGSAAALAVGAVLARWSSPPRART